MSETQSALDKAFNLLCDIMVKGCDVEKLADAKNYIRHAFQLASNTEVTQDGGQDDR